MLYKYVVEWEKHNSISGVVSADNDKDAKNLARYIANHYYWNDKIKEISIRFAEDSDFE